MPTNDKLDVKEVVQTSLLHLEGTRGEHTLTDDTIIASADQEKVSHDMATPNLHENEACVPLSNLPEEYCDELKKFSVEKVKLLL